MTATRRFLTKTFVEEGLLHYFNRRFFWSYGLSLTVNQFEVDLKRYQDTLLPRIEEALNDPAIKLSKSVNKQALATAILDALLPRAEGQYIDGMYLTEYEDLKPFGSELPKHEQDEKMRKALAWLKVRNEAMKNAE